MLEVKFESKTNGLKEEIADCRVVDHATKALSKCSQRNSVKLNL